MSEPDNDTIRSRLYTDTAEYKECIGLVRFISEWVNDTHSALDSLPDNKLRIRLRELDNHQIKFNNACSRLLGSLDPSIYESEYVYVRSQMQVVRDMTDNLKLKLEEFQPNKCDPFLSSTPLRNPTHIGTDQLAGKLPDLPLPCFDGRPDSWISFIEQFDSIVDSRPHVTPTMKLHYLVGALSHEPRKLIQHLKIEAGNYVVARDLLKRRYHNLRLLADTHIAQIMNLPIITSKLEGLRVLFLNPLLSSYRCLERLDLPVEQWSYMLVHICLGKLPTDLKSRFERRYGDDANKLPTFHQVITFLEDECRHYDNLGSAEVVDTAPSYPASPRTLPIRPKPVPRTSPPPRVYISRTIPMCFMCDSTSHYLRECPEFNSLSIRDRCNFVKDTRLCFRCLDKHSIAYCKREYYCGVCHRSSHHTLLCFNNPSSPVIEPNNYTFRETRINSLRDSPPRTGRRSPAPVNERQAPATHSSRSPPVTHNRNHCHSPPPSTYPNPQTTFDPRSSTYARHNDPSRQQ